MREFTPDMQTFMKGLQKLPEVLKQMGFEALRPGQDRAVMNLLNQRDTLAVAPTGGGKSAMYIIPTVCHGWNTLVISPLISLMQDQVTKLWNFGFQAAQISSGQTEAENRMALNDWEAGKLQFLLVSPERLEVESFRGLIARRRPHCVVVDEAHCISTWGTNFRPSYMQIGPLIKETHPRAVLALTATATRRVLADIRTALDLPNADQLIYLPKRKNLKLSSSNKRTVADLLYRIEEVPGSFIVYCLTVKACTELENQIGHKVKGGLSLYHGQLSDNERTTMQHRFMNGEIRGMVATNAFGMGVDKSDIRAIYHWDVPNSVEALSQEVGRAGRDGKESFCHLFADEQSRFMGRFLLDMNHPDPTDVQRVFYFLDTHGARDGELQMTLEEIAERCNLKGPQVSACVSALRTQGLVERDQATDKMSIIRILKAHEEPSFKKILDLVPSLGVCKNHRDRIYEVNLSVIAGEVKLAFSTVQSKIKDLKKNGYIEYTPPFRGKTLKLTGALKDFNFEELKLRKDEAYSKFEKAWQYPSVPDEDKHEFFLEYFQNS